MTIDSRTCVKEHGIAGHSLYSSSEVTGKATEESVWIQPSISRQTIDMSESSIIDGIYVRTRHPARIPVIEPDLALELEAWEAASDEALRLFEAECD